MSHFPTHRANLDESQPPIQHRSGAKKPKGPKGPKKPHRRVNVPVWLVVGLAAAVLVLFIVAVSGRTPSTEAVSTPVPAATPTTVTKTVEVATVPAECLAALDAADTGFNYAAEAMNYAADGFNAVSNMDADAMIAANDGITETTGKLKLLSPTYTDNRDACRTAAK